MTTKKSYWQSVSLHDEQSQEAIRSWFMGLADGMRCDKAEILCDIETDAEKRIRAVMTDADGHRHELIRTRGKRFSISSKRL